MTSSAADGGGGGELAVDEAWTSMEMVRSGTREGGKERRTHS
jgi:hypothetical protein